MVMVDVREQCSLAASPTAVYLEYISMPGAIIRDVLIAKRTASHEEGAEEQDCGKEHMKRLVFENFAASRIRGSFTSEDYLTSQQPSCEQGLSDACQLSFTLHLLSTSRVTADFVVVLTRGPGYCFWTVMARD
jgi:hypothetical protein